MIELAQRLLFGDTSYLKHSDLINLTRRHPFSAYLNYLAYDETEEIYLNQDSSFGILWECIPLTFAGEKTMTLLEGIYRAGVPKDTIIQFILHADSHIDPIIEAYRNSRARHDDIITENTKRVTDFLSQGKKGLEQCSGIPVRNFRLLVAVKIPGNAPGMPKPEELGIKDKILPLRDIKRHINETLRSANLYPNYMAPGALLDWTRRLFNTYPNGYPEKNMASYSIDIPINKQIVNADTTIKENGDHMQIGERYFCCTTPKSFPPEVDPFQTNTLFGGVWGLISDADQIRTPFLYCLNVVYEKGMEAKIHTKTNLMLNQQAIGSLSILLRRKQAEHMEATNDIEHGIQFLKIVPIFWVWDENLEVARESLTRVRRLWENNGYVMQRDNWIMKILLISSFPFCLYTEDRNLENLERDFLAPAPSITPLLPVQGDFAGSGGVPNLIFTGRKGQLISLDFFAKGANNFNCFCCATTGSGKSFLVNFIAFNYYACGSIIRIIDIGGSYKKMADMLGARYLDFSPDTKICLNPFTNIDDPKNELPAIVPLIMQMAYLDDSDTKDRKSIEKHVVRDAIEWAFAEKGNEADIDDVYHYLSKIPDLPNIVSEKVDANHVESAKKLASLIYDFTSKGSYGKFFCGRSTFDIRHDEFVVLELENLKVQPALYKVVTLLVIDAVTKDLYLSNRSRHRLIIFDEAWQFINEESTQISQVIDEGYRRARKYSGSFMVITQSILDMGKDKFGKVGTGIIGNAAYKIFLESGDFDKAKEEKLIDYDDFSMKLLKSVKSNPPLYSEVFFDTPFGKGVARLVVNDYAYFIYTSKATEIAMIEEKVKEGKTYHEAILEMVELRQNGHI